MFFSLPLPGCCPYRWLLSDAMALYAIYFNKCEPWNTKSWILTRAKPSWIILIPVHWDVLLEGPGWTWVMLCPERQEVNSNIVFIGLDNTHTGHMVTHYIFQYLSCQSLLSEFSRSGPVSFMIQYVTVENLIPLKHFHTQHARIFYGLSLFCGSLYFTHIIW